MTIPTSGALYLSMIHNEFGLGYNLGAYRGKTYWRDNGSSGTFPSTALAFSHFRGTRKDSPVSTWPLGLGSGSQINIDPALCQSLGWNGTDHVQVVLNAGATRWSTAVGAAALAISGYYPNGVSFVNNGTTVGFCGSGGYGGSIWGGGPQSGGPGGSGGDALNVQNLSGDIEVTNNGTLNGGSGGGGGGGASASVQSPFVGAGGGGGQATSNQATSGGDWGGGGHQGSGAGATGSSGGGPGMGGKGGSGGGSFGGNGGNGGYFGQAGQPGQNSNSAGGAGGYAGSAAHGNSKITWITLGTIRGARTG